jgi:hypothetical protein
VQADIFNRQNWMAGISEKTCRGHAKIDAGHPKRPSKRLCAGFKTMLDAARSGANAALLRTFVYLGE